MRTELVEDPWDRHQKLDGSYNSNPAWDGPYTVTYNYPPNEADVCECNSKFCVECSLSDDGSHLDDLKFTVRKVGCVHGAWPAYLCKVCYPLSPSAMAWLVYYKIKRRLGL